MPWTAALFLIGGMALAALPPLNGFMSEWATFQSLLHLWFEQQSTVLESRRRFSRCSFGINGSICLGGVVKHFGIAFLGLPRTSKAEQAIEVPISMRLGMMILAFGAIVLGILRAF